MNITVRYLAQLRQRAGRSEQRLTVADPCTVAEFFEQLAQGDERLREILLDGSAGIQPTILVFVGDEQAPPDRPLRDGDEVTLMTPIAGG